MEQVCPICNSLQTILARCPICDHLLLDGGIISDYFGPYSPYVEKGPQNYCVHLLYCENCHYDERQAFEYITV